MNWARTNHRATNRPIKALADQAPALMRGELLWRAAQWHFIMRPVSALEALLRTAKILHHPFVQTSSANSSTVQPRGPTRTTGRTLEFETPCLPKRLPQQSSRCFVASLPLPAMPVTVHPAGHPATIKTRHWHVEDAESLLERVRGDAHSDFKGLWQSSFDHLQEAPPITPSQHGFVMTAVEAYSDHLHLIIRPEDVWFAILTQLSFYINEHAEELRGSFVSHEGQKELKIRETWSCKPIDFGNLATRMGGLIEENLVDPTIRQWVQPSFTTTTAQDVTVASVIMMGAFKKYFSYTFHICCGLPSVTLLGEKKDWIDIQGRLDRIKDLGEEPAQWYKLLVPVLNHLVQSFDAPAAPDIRDFWQKIAHHSGGGSGPSYLSGWITAFCFWDNDGKCMYKPDGKNDSMDSPFMFDWAGHSTPRLFMADIPYHRVDTQDIPLGFASVPVKVIANEIEYKTMMLAGSVGTETTSSGEPGVDPDVTSDVDESGNTISSVAEIVLTTGLDTVQPVTGWFILEIDPEKEQEQEQEDPECEFLSDEEAPSIFKAPRPADELVVAA